MAFNTYMGLVSGSVKDASGSSRDPNQPGRLRVNQFAQPTANQSRIDAIKRRMTNSDQSSGGVDEQQSVSARNKRGY